MNKLSIFSSSTFKGQRVRFRLVRGEDLVGRVLEATPLYVTVENGESRVTLFEDLIGGWEVQQEAAEPGVHVNGKASTPQEVGSKENAKPERRLEEDKGAAPGAPESTSDSAASQVSLRSVYGEDRISEDRVNLMAAKVRIEATYQERVKHQDLSVPDPNFSFPVDEFTLERFHHGEITRIRQKWEQARAQFENAVKFNELGRLQRTVNDVLLPLYSSLPSAHSVGALASLLQAKMGRLENAKEVMLKVAASSREPRHLRLLAALALRVNDRELACVSLQKTWFVCQPSDHESEWMVYLGLALSLGDFTGLKAVFGNFLKSSLTPESLNTLNNSMIFVSLRLQVEAPIVDRLLEDVLASRGLVVGENWSSFLQVLPSTRSEQLQQAEAMLSLIPRNAVSRSDTVGQDLSRVEKGRLISFGNQMFGFIQKENEKVVFFNVQDVDDEALRQELLAKAFPKGVRVIFREVASPGHRYNRASQIRLYETVEEILSRAQQYLSSEHFRQAAETVRLALALYPGDSQGLKLEAEIEQRSRTSMQKGLGLPQGSGPYARAKRAQHVDQDFEQAETFFREAIKCGDKAESAVKDLANLLHQKGQSDEAISLLEANAFRFAKRESLDNLLSTLLQHAGRHGEAIVILQKMTARLRPSERSAHAILLRRIAFSQYKLGDYDKSEKTLRQLLNVRSDDEVAHRWLIALKEARASGSYAIAEGLFESIGDATDFLAALSPMAIELMDNCPFTAVDAKKLEAGKVTLGDVEKLVEAAKVLGITRRRARADHFLQAAALLRRFEHLADEVKMREFLFRSFASLGDAAVAERQHPDVARTYYLEALALATASPWIVLEYYLKIVAVSVEAPLPRVEHSREESVKALLLQLFKAASSKTRLAKDLLRLSASSGFASRIIWSSLRSETAFLELCGAMFNLSPREEFEDYKKAWEDSAREIRMELLGLEDSCVALTELQLTTASMEDLCQRLDDMRSGALLPLDIQYKTMVSKIASCALSFCRSTDFEDRESNYFQLESLSSRFIENVEKEPTRIAFIGFRPIAKHLRSLAQERYADILRVGTPDLTTTLSVETYIPSRDRGEIRLQVSVFNRQGNGPASDVKISVLPSDSPYFETTDDSYMIAPSIRGGAAIESHITLRATDLGLSVRAFPIGLRTTFQDRLGEIQEAPLSQYTIRLHQEEAYNSIVNRYSPYAGGTPLDDAEMFFGRDTLIKETMIPTLLAPQGKKCFVLYGQKRAGKSSVLQALRRELLEKGSSVITASISLYEIGTEVTVVSLLYRILEGFQSELLREAQARGIPCPMDLPGLLEFSGHPALLFHSSMSRLLRQMEVDVSWKGARLVLLVDEFTEVYKQIRKAKIDRELMKVWKSVLEKSYFSTVLVGQDIMPAFKSEFENEFGVTEDQRITYLSEEDASKMIQVPIGSDRFVGNAVSYALQLTAGSPFYLMMLCSRLVDYMNRERAFAVTSADIERVKNQMVTGKDRLSLDKFDNLLSPGDEEFEAAIPKAQVVAVCSAIATRSDKGWCPVSSLGDLGDDVARILDDLENRDVIEKRSGQVRLLVGLFHEWLRVNRAAL